MSVIAPPPPSTPKQPSDPEALIEEARRQTRRRRRRNAAAATLLLGLAALGIAAHGRGGSPTSETSTHRPAKLHVGTASSVMHNGPLTVVKQSVGHGGVYTVGRSGLGTMLLRCRGAPVSGTIRPGHPTVSGWPMTQTDSVRSRLPARTDHSTEPCRPATPPG